MTGNGKVNFSKTELYRILYDVATSGVEFDDPRLDWVSVQIDRDLWNYLKEVCDGYRSDS